MAEITKKRNGEFLREVYKLLLGKDEGMPVKEILSHLEENMELSEFESGFYKSTPNKPRFHKIVRFASIPLVKAGWLSKNKGRWFVTDEGVEAYKKFPNPEEFYREAELLYQEWKKARTQVEEELESIEEEPQSSILTFEEAEETAWEQIKEYLSTIGPFEFQGLVAFLLEAMGYHVNWISPPGKDKGIDIIAYNDPLGTSTPRIKVQVKHRIETRTNVEGLRSFLSTLGNDDVGIFLSSGGFTRDAIDEARTQETRKITLVDLETFFELWVEHYERLDQEARQSFPLKPVYYLAPED